MKAAEINPANVSISLIYCLLGFLSFFVLKIVSRYVHQRKDKTIEVEKGKLKEEDIEKVNFSKIFIKAYLLKNTLIGSMINQDKKYLLREILVLSSMGVSCFHINSYILWPWAIGFGVFLTTFLITEMLIPMTDERENKLKIDQSECSSRKNSNSVIDSNSIQIEHTELQLSVSAQKEVCLNGEKSQIGKSIEQLSKKERIHFVFILIMAVIAQILFCQSILTLSLSVSNSGVLNLVSFGLSFVIDQFIARTGLGLLSYLTCIILHKSQTVNFFENHIFVTYCHEWLEEEIIKVQSERIIEEMQHKISSINNPEIHLDLSNHDKESDNIHEISTEMKIVLPCIFEEVFEEVPVANSNILPVEALLEEPENENEEFEIVEEEKINHTNVVENSEIVEIQSEDVQIDGQEVEIIPIQLQEKEIDEKTEINYFELYEHDIEIFDATKAYENSKIVPVKKIKKKPHQSQQKFKSDPLLYFPYEEHKLSHKISVEQEFKEKSEIEKSESRGRSTIDNNFFSTIEVIDCTDDSVIREEPEINLILQEKNLNIKNLVVNEKPMVLPTERPGLTEKKKSERNENIQSLKKMSPYFVNLSSEAVKPKKTKKIQISKNNKENANQTNKSFMTQEAISISRITQKDQYNFANISNENEMLRN